MMDSNRTLAVFKKLNGMSLNEIINFKALRLAGRKTVDLILCGILLQQGFSDDLAIDLQCKLICSNANISSCGHQIVVPLVLTEHEYSKLSDSQRVEFILSIIGSYYVEEVYHITTDLQLFVESVIEVLRNSLKNHAPVRLIPFPGKSTTSKTSKEILYEYMSQFEMTEGKGFSLNVKPLRGVSFQATFEPSKSKMDAANLPLKRPISGESKESQVEAEEDTCAKVLLSLKMNIENLANNEKSWHIYNNSDNTSSSSISCTDKVSPPIQPPQIASTEITATVKDILSDISVILMDYYSSDKKARSILNGIYQRRKVEDLFRDSFKTVPHQDQFLTSLKLPDVILQSLGPRLRGMQFIGKAKPTKKDAEEAVAKYFLDTMLLNPVEFARLDTDMEVVVEDEAKIPFDKNDKKSVPSVAELSSSWRS